VKELIPKFTDRRKEKFEDWLEDNSRVEIKNEGKDLMLKNVCSKSVVIENGVYTTLLEKGEEIKLKLGFDVRIEGRLFTVFDCEKA